MKKLSTRYKALGIVLTLVLFLTSASNVFASVQLEVGTLKGIKSMNVIVEDLPSGFENIITQEQIKTDVELKLRLAGIKVVSNPVWPYLYINLNLLHPNDSTVICNVHLQFVQEVVLKRNTKIETLAATWDTSTTGVAGKAFSSEKIREAIKDQVDIFINDYLSVNSR